MTDEEKVLAVFNWVRRTIYHPDGAQNLLEEREVHRQGERPQVSADGVFDPQRRPVIGGEVRRRT